MTSAALLRGFGAVADAEPAQRASILANHVSESMNLGVFCAAPALALYAITLVTLVVGALRRSRPPADRSPRTG